MNERKPAPPPPVAVHPDEEWEDEGDRPTRSIPAAVLAEIHQRPPSAPPPSMPASVPTNGRERMIITDAMLGRADPTARAPGDLAAPAAAVAPPRMTTKTVKMTTMPEPSAKK